MSSALAEKIAGTIRDRGPIPVSDFMSMALYTPDLGYYMKGDPFGTSGDFVTAPEISQMFGELIGLWCAAVWSRTGSPSPVLLVEPGPGRGTLMADALRAIRVEPDFLNAVRVHLVETSPALRSLQQQRLRAEFPESTFAWHEHLAEVPDGPFLMFANEFLDAMPIRQFVREAGTWHERRVDVAASGFEFVLSPEEIQPPPEACMPRNASEGAIVETSVEAHGFVREIASRLERGPGAALFIDYGAAGPATGDSLQAVRNHAPCNVLDEPGNADITAHVNFAAICQSVEKTGARTFGPVTQREFLTRLGIEHRADRLASGKSEAEREQIEAGLARLVGAGEREMGDLFKVMAVATAETSLLPGFNSDD